MPLALLCVRNFSHIIIMCVWKQTNCNPLAAACTAGQHFLSHEDGFPSAIALDKGYQRRATLLIYLNDVPQGGQTQFDHLGFGVQPQRGKALLFFPSFSGGKSDARCVCGAAGSPCCAR